MSLDGRLQTLRTPAVQVLVAASAAFAAFFVVALIQGEKPFYYDSSLYWLLSESFVRDGHFSLLNFENMNLRGYALPLVYFVVRNGGEVLDFTPSVTVMIFNSALFALIGAVLAPRLARVIWPEVSFGIGRRLLLCGLILVFWRGYLSYPLSDFPALAAGLLALGAIGSSRSAPSMAVAGGAAALALDFRPAYFLLVPAVFVLAVWAWRNEGAHVNGRWLLRFAMLIGAFVVVSLPQSLSQHERYDSFSPIPGGSELAGFQYTEGLRLQRYDTYVGGLPEEASMRYGDGDTRGILRELEGHHVSDTGQYAEVIIENPVTMAGVFVRHLVNGLDQRYTTPYIEEFEDGSNRPFRFAGFLLVFIAAVRLAWSRARRQLGPARWRYAIALLLCCATSIASAVEARFLLPIFIFAALVAVLPGWRELISEREGKRPIIALATILVVGIVYFVIVGLIVRGASHSLALGVN